VNAVKIDKLQQKILKLKEDLHYWEVEFQPSGNMGKWGRSVRITTLSSKIKNIEDKIRKELKDGYYGGH
jgi:hypothetical protein